MTDKTYPRSCLRAEPLGETAWVWTLRHYSSAEESYLEMCSGVVFISRHAAAANAKRVRETVRSRAAEAVPTQLVSGGWSWRLWKTEPGSAPLAAAGRVTETQLRAAQDAESVLRSFEAAEVENDGINGSAE